jgi:hypothetical protein
MRPVGERRYFANTQTDEWADTCMTNLKYALFTIYSNALKINSIKKILILYLFMQFYSNLSVLFIDNTLDVHLTSRKFRFHRLL